MSTTNEELADRFAHHPPVNNRVASTHEEIRDLFTDLAIQLNIELPESREKSLALTALQEGCMWANASIAIHMNAQEIEG